MAFLLGRVKELEDKEDSETEEESYYPGETKENAAEVEKEGPPLYRDGMLLPAFWEVHWNVFRQCSSCLE